MYIYTSLSLVYVHSIVEFLTHPDNITVFNGTEVKFSCVVVDSDLLSFTVNGSYADIPCIMNKGFRQLVIELINPTTQTRNLTATALTQYNNTKIQCLAIEFGNPEQLISDTGTLLVQGKLLLRLISLY